MEAVELKLRTEQPADYRETENVTREAFWNLYSPGCCEHYLLHVMRDSPAFVPELDLVASAMGESWAMSFPCERFSTVTTERTVRC